MPLSRMHLYQVVGRKAPTDHEPNPPAYRMKIFATSKTQAKSRFWYFMQLQKGLKLKKSTGEVLDVNEITEKDTSTVKNYGIWIRYDSRSGTHNMYREYRDTCLTRAVDKMYRDMAGRHRTRFRSIHIIRTDIVPDEECRRPIVQQYLGENVQFPLPHRILKPAKKSQRSKFLAQRPSTFYG